MITDRIFLQYNALINYNNIIEIQLIVTNLQPNLNLIKPRPKLVVCST
jgi:hypothetical protein